MRFSKPTIKSYAFSILLLASIIAGGFFGVFFSTTVSYLKPLGEIFLHLIFTTIVPLIFFSISSAITKTKSFLQLGQIMMQMSWVFLFTGLIAAVYALTVVLLFPPSEGVIISLTLPKQLASTDLAAQLSSIITVPEFYQLLSHQHILALIFFSLLVGIAAKQSELKTSSFTSFLEAGEIVFMQVFNLVMYLAPLGFFAYFAVLVSELGPQLIESYMRVCLIYTGSALLYFFIAYTFFAYLSDRKSGIRLFWAHVPVPALTALATCSSAASIPANLHAAKDMKITSEVADTVVPLGSLIHKDGSVLGGMFKIAFLFGIFHLSFSGTSVLLTAIGVSLLVGTVMGAIPSGGMLGELLILSVYGFPPSALILIAAISIIIDPIATMLNVTGNTVSTMLIASRLTKRKKCPIGVGS